MANITPDPTVLLALTNTPLKPIDALCELIDNAFDSFHYARQNSFDIPQPWIQIDVPGEAEVKRGEGVVRIADNGVGLDDDGLTKALTAGYSSKNQYDTLGLFGMGFNIATGKLGRVTTITTCRSEDDFATRTVLDIPALVLAKSFDIVFERVPKPMDFDSGTIVEVTGWWQQGSANADFIKKLSAISKRNLSEQIGRRYATYLRRDETDYRIQVLLNSEAVKGFEHCVWDASRFVERQDWGRIYARQSFDEVLRQARHCAKDKTVLTDSEQACPTCAGTVFRVVDERIKGWVGIQRFDDTDRYGIDLIRNGRAIKIAEKDAFFFFEDEYGGLLKEYPIDAIYGRIVGEVHLDHVSVDYTKQDFQRTTEEWQRAVSYLRGGSLLEKNWPEGYKNTSPIGKLFKGFRKVRKPGRDDMYMGRYDEVSKKPVRIGREVESDFYERFLRREDGFYTDANWWKLVEDASHPPLNKLSPCPKCGYQVSESEESCEDCGEVLKGKACEACNQVIPVSAISCSLCGASQVPETTEPWKCALCETINSELEDICVTCGSVRGTDNPMDPKVLASIGIVQPTLCFKNQVFELPNGKSSNPVSITTYLVPSGQLVPKFGHAPVAMAANHSVGNLIFYVDETHPSLSQGNGAVEGAISLEVAQYLSTLHPEIGSQRGYTLSSFASSLAENLWPHDEDTDDSILKSITELLSDMCALIQDSDECISFYKELSKDEQTYLTQNLIRQGKMDKLSDYIGSGAYINFVSARTLARFQSANWNVWASRVWKAQTLPELIPDDERAQLNSYMRRPVQHALEVCADYVEFPMSDTAQTSFVKAALEYLRANQK